MTRIAHSSLAMYTRVVLFADHHAAQLQPVVERHQAAGEADQNGERTGNQQGSEGIAQIGQTLALLRLRLCSMVDQNGAAMTFAISLQRQALLAAADNQ